MEELSNKIIPVDHLRNICQYRQGKNTCKYIIFFKKTREFCCVKNIQGLRAKIDTVEMVAQGNNCDGL